MRTRSSFFCMVVATTAAIATLSEAAAQAAADRNRPATNTTAAQTDADANDAADARRQVEEATEVVNQMKRDPQLLQLLQRAQGVFIVPSYGKAAAVVGGRGGEGVFLVRRQNEWSNPAFFNLGRISVGAQAGAAGGSIAMLLMSDKAVRMFEMDRNNFSLDAAAGVTIIEYSKDAQASTAAGVNDVIVWSDTEGLFAGASVGVSGIMRDEEENRAYYMQPTTTEQIFSGVAKNPHAQSLRDALPDRMAGR